MPTSVDVNPCPDGEVKYDASGYLELSSIGSAFANPIFSDAERIAEGKRVNNLLASAVTSLSDGMDIYCSGFIR